MSNARCHTAHMPNQQANPPSGDTSFGVPYHKQKRGPRGEVLPVSVCPVCGAEYPMDRKDFESCVLSSEAVAHVRSHQ